MPKLSKWLFIVFLFISRPVRTLYLWFRDAVVAGHWYTLDGQRRTVRLCWRVLRFYDSGLIHAPHLLHSIRRQLEARARNGRSPMRVNPTTHSKGPSFLVNQ
jgi:hypothetical protein